MHLCVAGKVKRWNLGVRTSGPGAFGIAPNSYFTDNTNNAEETDLLREEHKHCFVWKRAPGPFKVWQNSDNGQSLKHL